MLWIIHARQPYLHPRQFNFHLHQCLNKIRWLNRVDGGQEFCKHQTVLFQCSFLSKKSVQHSYCTFFHCGDVSVIVEMLDTGIPVDIGYDNGLTALMHLAFYNSIYVVHVLLQKRVRMWINQTMIVKRHFTGLHPITTPTSPGCY